MQIPGGRNHHHRPRSSAPCCWACPISRPQERPLVLPMPRKASPDSAKMPPTRAVGIISAMFLTALVGGIFAESGLAFLGIGNTNGLSWGLLIGQAQQQGALLRGLWWWFLPPGICIALIGFATALINFGLDEVTNPALNAKLAAR